MAVGATDVMLDIARSEVVPGANDNLSAVGALVAVAEGLSKDPVPGVRTLLISTGSEESFSEGMLKMRHYPAAMREALADAAAEAGVNITRGIRTVAATDAIIALRAGYPTVTLASIADTKLPLNYHWPTDRPEALHWDTIEQAIAVCSCFLRRRANRGTLPELQEENSG